MTEHKIACGALVVRDQHILLVHHVRPGVHDFWIAPGGGVEGDEPLSAAAEREVREETGLTVRATRLAYIDQLASPTRRSVTFWFLADVVSGSLSVHANPAAEESITEARWFSRAALPQGPVFPDPLRAQFWDDLAAGFAQPILLPLKPARY